LEQQDETVSNNGMSAASRVATTPRPAIHVFSSVYACMGWSFTVPHTGTPTTPSGPFRC
jgi:hypothetical protein